MVECKDSFYFSDSHDAKSSTYNLVHASLAWQVDRMELRLWGRNLTDTSYSTFYFVSMKNRFLQQGKPLQWGATLTWNF